MRPGTVSTIATYILAVVAVFFFVIGWATGNVADFTATACFLLLAGVWLHVCS